MTNLALTGDLVQQLGYHTGLRTEDADRVCLERRLREHDTLVGSQEDLHTRLEWLAAALTPGETFFFRDHGQFDLLRFHVLPRLIEARREARRLRLWSAGCSSGEEAYSLAMLIDMLLPDHAQWQLEITGTDLNDDALQRARVGRYGRWSFRALPSSLLARYFRRDGDAWLLDARIRAMVQFRHANLVDRGTPTPQAQDLVLCRNVLIYFSPAAVGAVAARLAASLADQGFLLVGHTELLGQALPGLCTHLFPEGLVYQRAQPVERASGARAPLPPRPAAPSRTPVSRPASLAPVAAAPEPAADPCAAARALADRGDYAAAEAACAMLIDADPLAPEPYFLLAQLAQLAGRYGQAETLLQRVLYLAPECVAACLELAALQERAGLAHRALAQRQAALRILRTLPAQAPVAPFDATAAELADWLQASTEGRA